MTSNDTVSNRHGSAVITLPSDTEILITRVFDAPAELVFKAYTTPELVKRWWGFETSRVARLRDRPARRRPVALRHPRATTWRSASTASTARSTRPHRLVSTEVYEGVPDPDDDGVAQHR